MSLEYEPKSDMGVKCDMADASSDMLFEVLTPLGFRVRVTHTIWELISTIKHPVMAGRERAVQETLSNPEQVRQSRRDPQVYLFYRLERAGRWICAV